MFACVAIKVPQSTHKNVGRRQERTVIEPEQSRDRRDDTTMTGRHSGSPLERIAVRALGVAGPMIPPAARPVWSDAAKDRLYRRMFPVDVCTGPNHRPDAQLGA